MQDRYTSTHFTPFIPLLVYIAPLIQLKSNPRKGILHWRESIAYFYIFLTKFKFQVRQMVGVGGGSRTTVQRKN